MMADQPSTSQDANCPSPTLLPARRRRSPRRRVLRAALWFSAFLAMGMAINLLVAAAIWVRAEHRPDRFEMVRGSVVYLQAADWILAPPTGLEPKWPGRASAGLKVLEITGRQVHHQYAQTVAYGTQTERYDIRARSVGWPFQSMQTIEAQRTEWWAGKKQEVWWYARMTGDWAGGIEGQSKVAIFPLHFIARGTVLNTLVYASALALLVLATRFGIAWVRLRRRLALGRCRACGYDCAGLAVGAVCPECGAKRSGVEREDAKIAKG